MVANLTVLRAGEYTFTVSATDVFRHKDAFIVKYTSELVIKSDANEIM